MNNQTEQGREPQRVVDLENAAGSIGQVLKVLYCFTEFCEDGYDAVSDGNSENAVIAFNFVERLQDQLSLVNVSCESLERVIDIINNYVSAAYTVEQSGKKAVHA